MNESCLSTIAQLEEFPSANAEIEFTPRGGDANRYEHISRVFKRFDYPRRNKRERRVVLRYLRHTSGYSRAQSTRLLAQWADNRFPKYPLPNATAHPQRRLPANTRPVMSPYWSKWAKPMKTFAARP